MRLIHALLGTLLCLSFLSCSTGDNDNTAAVPIENTAPCDGQQILAYYYPVKKVLFTATKKEAELIKLVNAIKLDEQRWRITIPGNVMQVIENRYLPNIGQQADNVNAQPRKQQDKQEDVYVRGVMEVWNINTGKPIDMDGLPIPWEDLVRIISGSTCVTSDLSNNTRCVYAAAIDKWLLSTYNDYATCEVDSDSFRACWETYEKSHTVKLCSDKECSQCGTEATQNKSWTCLEL